MHYGYGMNFQMPLLILNQSQDMWTLPLFQYNFKSQYSFDYNLAFASYLIAMIPVLIAYACAQKHICFGFDTRSCKVLIFRKGCQKLLTPFLFLLYKEDKKLIER